MHRKSICPALLLALALLPGCDATPRMNYDAVELVPARGVVTLDGRPLPSAVVTFEAPNGQFSYAMTAADGRYALQFDSVQPGVTPGPKTVRISTTRKIVGLNTEEGEGGEEGEPGEGSQAPANAVEEKVPARYNEDSQLTVEVSPDQTEYNFDLVSS